MTLPLYSFCRRIHLHVSVYKDNPDTFKKKAMLPATKLVFPLLSSAGIGSGSAPASMAADSGLAETKFTIEAPAIACITNAKVIVCPSAAYI